MRCRGRVALALVLLALSAVVATAQTPLARPGVRYLMLVRHGDYDRDSAADDRVGNGLNALGRQQAQLTGRRLAALPVRFDALVSSDYTRARETADLIGQALHMTAARDSLLRECSPTRERADPMRLDAVDRAAVCDSTLALAWRAYVRPSPATDARQVLVCHGNVIRWFTCRALGVPTSRWGAMDIGNGSITVIAVHADGSTRLASFSDVGHLQGDQQTWTGSGAGWSPPPAGHR
jgi:serine/threonine-protein phosphatase PGAM5